MALFFFATNGSLIKYAQEVRMYSLFLCLSLFSIWIFTRFFYRGKNIWILALINIVLIYTHYFGWFVVFSEVLAIVILQRIKLQQMLIMFGANIVAFVPWALIVLRAANSGSSISQNIGWIERPGIRSIFDLIFDVIEPFYFQQSSSDVSTILWITLPLLVIFAAVKLNYLFNWKRHNEWDRFWLMSIAAATPIFFAFWLSYLLPVSIWGSRHLIVAFLPLTIIMAVYVTEIAFKPLNYFFISAIFLISSIAFVIQVRSGQEKFIWCAWEHLAEQIPSDRAQTIYAFEDLVAYHLWFATRKRENIRIVKLEGLPDIIEDKAYFLPRGFDDIRRIKANEIDGQNFWAAFRDNKSNIETSKTQSEPIRMSLTSQFSTLGFLPGESRKIEAADQN
ncbi:MAG: hypothetical protein ACRD6X_22375, partial [Pyrinomonadaceae bacterium]